LLKRYVQRRNFVSHLSTLFFYTKAALIFILSITCRKLGEATLENAVLQDSTIRSNGGHKKQICTVGTSGHFRGSIVPSPKLLPSIKVIKQEDIEMYSAGPECLGEGRFGKCYVRIFNHYKVCIKVFKDTSKTSLIAEANILSKLCHPHLPYLFGVCIGDQPCLVTSYHDLNDESVTLHKMLASKIETDSAMVYLKSIKWVEIIRQITCGLNYLHTKNRIIHNDIKTDNICLTLTITTEIKAVIVDFGKACALTSGKRYELNEEEKKRI